jgi:phospholipid/cholesterol/gamma-HCH transport system permease protein
MITLEQTEKGIEVLLSGDWTLANAEQMETGLEGLSPHTGQSIHFRAHNLENIDLTGAWLIQRRARQLQQQGFDVSLDGFDSEHFRFLQELERGHPEKEQEELRPPALEQALAKLGKSAIDHKDEALEILDFLGRSFTTLLRGLLNPRHLRLRSIAHHVYAAGIKAVPIVALIAFLISIVVAYQGAAQLERFGALIYTIDLVAISVLREMGVLLTAIMVAGRSGSAYAAEIGVMKTNEEVDAMMTMGLNPFEYLVIPRILALMIALPLLTFVANIMGLTGAALLSVTLLDIPLVQYLERVQDIIKPMTFWVGIIKAPVFAFLIALVGTMRGMQVTGSAESVGRLTTQAVVESIFLVIVADALFSILFSKLGI